MFGSITEPRPGLSCISYCLCYVEAVFTVPYTASVVENLQLEAIMVHDRMINVQVGWHGNKIIIEEKPATCICNLSTMEIADYSVCFHKHL